MDSDNPTWYRILMPSLVAAFTVLIITLAVIDGTTEADTLGIKKMYADDAIKSHEYLNDTDLNPTLDMLEDHAGEKIPVHYAEKSTPEHENIRYEIGITLDDTEYNYRVRSTYITAHTLPATDAEAYLVFTDVQNIDLYTPASHTFD